ncbi:predicted protein [Histoplasma mississippiense (nom. inval.)]|uniref:predicted protein n=1 Tax=Ajellomyces capsulatus (strain NAm1 / WU24) TaxID=2059318 RepID=UPI000157B7AC|nr:predicted protein [Histoplasma mississippiense (nom. inval.)]EDN03900.1 predicted protein [Histoplasma mississippiense (nom. inval.)]
MFSADFHFINETPPKRPKRRRLGHSPARRAPAKPPQSISNCECRILWKSIECIHERVVILEQMICELGRADYLNSAFGGPVCRSKDIKQQVLKISSSGASLKCPASPRMTFDEDTHAEPSYPSSRKQNKNEEAIPSVTDKNKPAPTLNRTSSCKRSADKTSFDEDIYSEASDPSLKKRSDDHITPMHEQAVSGNLESGERATSQRESIVATGSVLNHGTQFNFNDRNDEVPNAETTAGFLGPGESSSTAQTYPHGYHFATRDYNLGFPANSMRSSHKRNPVCDFDDGNFFLTEQNSGLAWGETAGDWRGTVLPSAPDGRSRPTKTLPSIPHYDKIGLICRGWQCLC